MAGSHDCCRSQMLDSEPPGKCAGALVVVAFSFASLEVAELSANRTRIFEHRRQTT